ncbi:PREDICTED: putative serine carboxypeptidase-like 53 [Populus euphratica]|uniref:Serine carboxypeptidase-like 53 n=1 Tax=Populus euphratica TaxID=75702 RepID=A0AAJ6UPR6_POPEU|nr:PREDICTED: putative serine carboxypeptidase-like 53 [Populus euphratica]
MESNPCLPLVFFLVSCSIAQIEAGMRQSEALGHLYKAKLEGNSNIDSALFQATEHVDMSKFHHQEGLKEKDRIESSPGQPKVEFSQYDGYVTVDKSAGRALYYYFVEAQHSKESSPLLLWLNGGERSQDKEDLLQKQGVQRAHFTQGHPVQEAGEIKMALLLKES